jgi:hypothetical protein
VTEPEKVYIAALARTLNRREDTCRGWCRTKKLPSDLMPQRDTTSTGGLGWRYWTPEQVRGIKRWMVERNMTPGAGLRNFDPTPEESDELLTKLRRRQVA